MYVVFSETIAKNRRNGARGGRTFARNLRLRKLLAPTPPTVAASDEESPETAHEASLLLDRQFPWLEVANLFALRVNTTEKFADGAMIAAYRFDVEGWRK